MRIGIYGGTFDPVHLAHLLLAETARDHCALDRVVFVPAGIPPHKRNRKRASGEDRFRMLVAATAPYPEFEVSRFEIDSPDVSYTVATVRHFQSLRPADEFFLIVGSETLADIPYWYESRALCRRVSIITAWCADGPEPDFAPFAWLAPEELGRWQSQVVPMPKMEISATDIRAHVHEGRSIRFRVVPEVEEYIRAHGLYQND